MNEWRTSPAKEYNVTENKFKETFYGKKRHAPVDTL